MFCKDGIDEDGCRTWPKSFEETYCERGYWQSATFDDEMIKTVNQHADKTAFIDKHGAITFAEFANKIKRLALGFAKLGLSKGDNVVLQLTNSIALVEVFFALVRLGVRPILALPANRHNEIQAFCQIGKARAYITEDDRSGFDYTRIADIIAKASGKPEHIIIVGNTDIFIPLSTLYTDNESTYEKPNAGETVCFQLSGGTTGIPKLIPRKHREYLYQIRTGSEICKFNSQTVYMVALPAVHNFTLAAPGLLGAFFQGGTTVFSNDPGPETCFDLIRRENVTVTSLVPPVVLIWMEAISLLGTKDLQSLKLIQVGGAKLNPEAAKRVLSIINGFDCKLQQVFGMAEGLICYTRLDDDINRIIETQGRPGSEADEIRIVDESGDDVVPGATGSLLTRGPYTIRGYYNTERQYQDAFTENGYYISGDRAYMTELGDIVVTGRDKDHINRGGEKISAEEIENILLANPAILDAAAVSIPDEILGEKLCVYVIRRTDDLDVAAIKQFVRLSGAAAYKVPDKVEFLTSFPETGVGKTSRKQLRELLSSHHLKDT